MDPISVIRDDHGGAVSLHEQEHSVEILVGVDENASSGKDRPHFVSLKANQVVELAFELAQRLPDHELVDLVRHVEALARSKGAWSLMATTFQLEEGGTVTCAAGPFIGGGYPPGFRLLRLEVFGRALAQGSAAYLKPHEIVTLSMELARRLPPVELVELRSKLASIFEDPGDAGEEGGEPT
jgi:hypothetical protein